MQTLMFWYRNYRSVTALRKIQDPKFWYGETEYHKGQQWLLRGYDLEKEQFRDFAVADILTFVQDN